MNIVPRMLPDLLARSEVELIDRPRPIGGDRDGKTLDELPDLLTSEGREAVELTEEVVATGVIPLLISFDEMVEKGQAGLPVLTGEQHERLLQGLRNSQSRSGMSSRWLEISRLSDESFVIYPQDDGWTPSFVILLPIRSPDHVRLQRLDIGLVRQASVMPTLAPPSPCEPGYDDEGHYFCVHSTCAGDCHPILHTEDGYTTLVGCRCD